MGSELVRNASVTYEETINWHLCIDATPKKKGKYLVAYSLTYRNQRSVAVGVDTYSGAAWTKRKKRIIAWAEMPKANIANVFFCVRTIGTNFEFGGRK